MSKLTKKRKIKSKKQIWQKLQQRGRKKHVETMFITNKQKNYPFYHKPSFVSKLEENNYNKCILKKKFFHIKCLRSGYVTLHPLKALIRLFKFFSKNLKLEKDISYKLFIFPDFVLTSKPKEVRMGKGKGSNFSKVALVRKSQVVFSLSYTNKCLNILPTLVKKLSFKLPLRAVVFHNNW